MPLQTIEPRRLYRQIADQLRVLIEQGEFDVGSRLPPERDLAAKLGVSRPSVREALIALEIEGLVEVRMGSGIYVVPREVPRQGPVTAEGPLEIIRARQTIEAELAAVAARHSTPALVAGLRESLAVMREEARAGRVPTEGDRLFHTRIAAASENSVLLRVVSELFDERHNPLFAQLSRYFESSDSWAHAIDEHAAVIDAIANGDPQAARQAMFRHLGCSYERFNASWSSAQASSSPDGSATLSHEAHPCP